MNNKLIYLPISFLVLLSIVLLALEIPAFGLMSGFLTLLIISICLSILLAMVLYLRYRSEMTGEGLYTFIGTSLVWSFVFFLAIVSIINRRYATNNCERASYIITAYQGRYTSGYGNVKKGKLQANQWILKIDVDGQEEQYTLEKDIYEGESVTRSKELEFCKGVFGTKYLRLE